MPRKMPKATAATGQLEPLLKAFALRRLQEGAGGPMRPPRVKSRPKRAKKAKKA